ncbi:hypothetical protein PYCCODRAFT_1478461 [Trametes coccinea BRFM310]|uniref:Uncharacterized protein n=1 Tax=Trametes coccinea (strain BRFM310) TaxID=1353009 RepID=A0A1Y2IJW3_TRAC3|nr:hypothetical protein PYCCODRAFT_1478461 [Trametes coccinea BRFM310]
MSDSTDDEEQDERTSSLMDESTLQVQVKHLVKLEARRLVKKMLAKLENRHAQGKRLPKVPLELARAVRDEMLAAMGVERVIGGRRKKQRVTLPQPLAPGTPPRYALDGSTRLYNPDWNGHVDDGVNLEYIMTIQRLIQENGVVKYGLPQELAHNHDLVIKAAHTYFRTLRRQYQADHNEAARAKHKAKLETDKHNVRRHRKASFLRTGIKPFRRVFGHAATQGVEDLVHSPWQSSEDSSDGVADPNERDRMRRMANAGFKALELRTLRWRGRQLSALYLTLAVFARFQAERAGELDSDDIVSEDLTEAERAAYLAKVRQAVQEWQSVYMSKDLHYDRFRGPAANHRDLPREDKKRRPIYKECISRRWAKENETHSQIYDAAPHCPDGFTIFDLELPLDLLPERDREWLHGVDPADSEDT